MPFSSQAQRRYLFSQHPEIAEEFAAATPKGKKLPERVVKKAFDAGLQTALRKFGTVEEIRLQLPKREFHGFDAALRSTARGEKKAEGPNAEQLAEVLQTFDSPQDGPEDIAKDRLDRDTLWGSPSHLGAGDTANRVSDMGQSTGIGTAF